MSFNQVFTTITEAINLLGMPVSPPEKLCPHPVDEKVAIFIHALLRRSACYNFSEGACIPCFLPDGQPKDCSNGPLCYYTVAHCFFQWCLCRIEEREETQEEQQFTGCNFRHQDEAYKELKRNIFGFLDFTYGNTQIADYTMFRVEQYYLGVVCNSNYMYRTIPVYLKRNDGIRPWCWKKIYLSNDSIFGQPAIPPPQYEEENKEEVRSVEEIIKKDEELFPALPLA